VADGAEICLRKETPIALNVIRKRGKRGEGLLAVETSPLSSDATLPTILEGTPKTVEKKEGGEGVSGQKGKRSAKPVVKKEKRKDCERELHVLLRLEDRQSHRPRKKNWRRVNVQGESGRGYSEEINVSRCVNVEESKSSRREI